MPLLNPRKRKIQQIHHLIAPEVDDEHVGNNDRLGTFEELKKNPSGAFRRVFPCFIDELAQRSQSFPGDDEVMWGA